MKRITLCLQTNQIFTVWITALLTVMSPTQAQKYQNIEIGVLQSPHTRLETVHTQF